MRISPNEYKIILRSDFVVFAERAFHQLNPETNISTTGIFTKSPKSWKNVDKARCVALLLMCLPALSNRT